jgi:hypothetical protein
MTEKTPVDQMQKVGNDLDLVTLQVKNKLNLSFDIEIITEMLLSFETWLWKTPEIFIDAGVRLVIDIGNDVKLTNFLAYEAVERDFVHVILERPFDKHAGETVKANTFYLEPSYIHQAYWFMDMITNHNWSNLAIVYDRDKRNIELAEEFKMLAS